MVSGGTTHTVASLGLNSWWEKAETPSLQDPSCLHPCGPCLGLESGGERELTTMVISECLTCPRFFVCSH